MNPYRLSSGAGRAARPRRSLAALRRLAPLMADQKRSIVVAFVATLVASGASLAGAVHHRPHGRHLHPERATIAGVLRSRRCCCSPISLGSSRPTCRRCRWAASAGACCSTCATRIFTKLQQLPLDFFNQNKAGDLISRINNDTDKLNQFFAQALVQFAANLFLMARRGHLPGDAQRPARAGGARAGRGRVRHHARHRRLGEARERDEPAVARRAERRDPGEPEQLQGHRRLQPGGLLPAAVRRGERAQLRRVGARRRSPTTFFMPLYGLAFNLAQLIVLAYGFYLIAAGSFTVGPADRLPAVREQLLHAAPPARRGVVVVPAGAGELRPHLGGARARVRTCRSCRAEPARAAGAVLAFDHVQFGYSRDSRCCATRPSRSSAARPTRWSDRPAAARPPRRR